MSLSNYAELEILDHIFGRGVYTPPTIYVALSTADPGEAAATIAEPTDGSYARVATAGSDWNDAAAGAIDNSEVIEFAASSESWGTITHFALYDALTAGNFLGSGALDTSVAVGANFVASFAIETLTITLD